MKPIIIRFWPWFVIVALLLFVSIWAITSISSSKQSRYSLEEKQIDPNESHAQKLLCGPKSLCIALRRLGIPTQQEVLNKSVRLTKRGVEMGELLRLASAMEQVNAKRTSLTWNELETLEGTALLFVNDNHFVVADPREKYQTSQEKKQRIRIYDEKKPARWLMQAELEEIWDGDAIVLRRKLVKNKKDVCIEWEHCLIDTGYFKREDICRHRFHFRNLGNKTLQIESIKKSCNCSSYEVSGIEIPPGQSGWIEGITKMDGRRGKFRSFLFVKTNDSYQPEVVLVMEAFIYNEHILSKDTAYFGQIPQGKNSSLKIFIHDPGEENLKILNSQIELATCQSQYDNIQTSLELVPVDQESEYLEVMGAYPVKVGDYLMRPIVNIDNGCPIGPFTGKIVVHTNLKSPLNRIEIPLEGNVIPHVHSYPRVVMLTLGPDNYIYQKISLESLTNRKFKVLSVSADANDLISIKPLSGHKDELCYEIRALPAAVNSTERLIQTAVHFRLNERSVLDVPVMIFRRER